MPWLVSVLVSTAPGLAHRNWASRCRFEFGGGVEQFGAAAGALELAGALFMVQGAGTGRSVPCSRRTAMLFGGQFAVSCHGISFPKILRCRNRYKVTGLRGDDHLQHVGEPAGIAEGETGVIDHIVHFPARRRVHQHHRVVPVGGLCLARDRWWRQGRRCSGPSWRRRCRRRPSRPWALKQRGEKIAFQHGRRDS